MMLGFSLAPKSPVARLNEMKRERRNFMENGEGAYMAKARAESLVHDTTVREAARQPPTKT